MTTFHSVSPASHFHFEDLSSFPAEDLRCYVGLSYPFGTRHLIILASDWKLTSSASARSIYAFDY